MKETIFSGNTEYSFNDSCDLYVDDDSPLFDIWSTHINIQLDDINCDVVVECKGKKYKLIEENDLPKLVLMEE